MLHPDVSPDCCLCLFSSERAVDAGSFAIIALLRPLEKAGPLCTLDASPTIMKACGPLGASDTLQCHLLTLEYLFRFTLELVRLPLDARLEPV